MIKLILTIIAVTIFLQGKVFPSQAAEPGSHWPAVLDKLEARGISRLGDFDFVTFRAEAAKIQWQQLAGAPESVQSGSRASGYYLWKGGKAYVNGTEKGADTLAQLELHEALGATGYNDADYSLSISLFALSRLERPKLFGRMKDIYGKSLFAKKNLRFAGGSSVSGGGDRASIEVKTAVLNYLLSTKKISDASLAFYPLIIFEPLRGPGADKVHLKYEVTPQPDARGRQHFLSILFPVSRWEAGSRPLLVQEIGHKILTFQPKPVTWFDPAMTKWSTTIPALATESEPRTPGQVYFNCRFTYATGSIDYLLTVPVGVRMLATKTWSLDGNDTILGETLVSATEGISKITVRYVPAGSHFYEVPKWITPRSGNHAKAQMELKGQTLSYECRKVR